MTIKLQNTEIHCYLYCDIFQRMRLWVYKDSWVNQNKQTQHEAKHVKNNEIILAYKLIAFF